MTRHEPHWGAGWSENTYDDHPFRLRYKVDRQGAKPRLTHLCVEPAAGSELTITRAVLRQVETEALRLVQQDTAWWEALADGRDPFALVPERWTEADLPTVRDLWIKSRREGKSPRKVLADLGVSARTADRLISRARAKWPEEMGPPTRGPSNQKETSDG